MRILTADLEGFRNFESAQFRPAPQLTAVIGANGQGKTNLIEALYLVAALRPLRPVPRRALVREGERTARIAVRILRRQTGLEHDLEVRLEGSSRTLLRDDKKLSASEFIGNLVTVSFTPDDLQLAKGGPDARRRFLDRALLNARPGYLGRALRYAKAMKDRNRLLAKQASDAEIDAFDAVLAKEGASIVAARTTYVERIAPRVVARFDDIAQPAPPLTVSYSTSLRDRGAGLEDALMEELAARRPRDRQRATTSIGPHLDDLRLEMGGAMAKERASQGQHRALVLALKLVEIEELTEDLGEPPVLLLDDMSSELDADRTRQLFASVGERDGQVILTSTTPAEALASALGGDRGFCVHRVHAGVLAPAEVFSPAPNQPPETS